MAVPVLESHTTTNTDVVSTSIVLTKPTGVVAGDLLMLVIYTNWLETTNQFTTPSGWSLVKRFTYSADNISMGVYRRIADGTEGATQTVNFTTAAACHNIGHYLRFSGIAEHVTPVDPSAGTSTSGSTAVMTFSADPVQDDEALIFGLSIQDTNGGAPLFVDPAYGTYQWDAAPAWAIQSCSGFSCILAPSGVIAPVGTIQLGRASSTGSYLDAMAGFSFQVLPLFKGIETVTPGEFDYDVSLITISGLDFEAIQGTGKVYISDVNTLVGGTNEVDVSSAVITWANDQITLNLSNLSNAEYLNLDALGIGNMYIIVTNNSSDEYSSPGTVLTHRAKAFELSASSFIAASGENTTAQLAPPAGKTTGQFSAGRIQDDENPTDTISIAVALNYTEIEWSIESNGYSVLLEDYEFRLDKVGTILATPEINIDDAPPPVVTRRIFNI